VLARNGGFAAASRTGDAEEQDEHKIELAKMREIDTQSEARLKEALQHLAAASPQSAPAEMQAELLGKFRRHHARRRWIRRGEMLALAACIALAAILSWRSGPQQHSAPQNFARGNTGRKEIAAPTAPVVATGAKPATKMPERRRSPRRQASAANRAFLALPAYDPTVPLDELQVVRVQLPASALWKIGAPVPPDFGERRMTADFVVGQDGTAYAVRLVQ
jgi:negative regulator of sigma E activity